MQAEKEAAEKEKARVEAEEEAARVDAEKAAAEKEKARGEAEVTSVSSVSSVAPESGDALSALNSGSNGVESQASGVFTLENEDDDEFRDADGIRNDEGVEF